MVTRTWSLKENDSSILITYFQSHEDMANRFADIFLSKSCSVRPSAPFSSAVASISLGTTLPFTFGLLRQLA